MHIRRFLAVLSSALLAINSFGMMPSSAETNAQGYDLSGFAYQWPEKFSQADTLTKTDHSYQSHDVNIEITKYAFNRVNGDVNANETLNISDAVLLARIISEDQTLTLTDTGLQNADCNEDGELDIKDVTTLLSFLAGNLSEKEYLVDHHQVFTVADFYVRSIDLLRGAFAYGEFPKTGSARLEPISKMAKDNNALLAINCDYVEIRDNGITYRNGIMYRDKARAELAVIYKDGTMEVMRDKEYRALTDERKAEIWQTTSFAPILVKDSEVRTQFSGSVYTEKHPRSAIGYFEPGHFCFVLADGRQPGYSMGVSIADLAKFMSSLGVTQAFNMDGGSSSEMIFLGETINHPSGIQVGTTGGRSSSDILYVCEPKDIPSAS